MDLKPGNIGNPFMMTEVLLCPFEILQKHRVLIVACLVVNLALGLILQANVLYQCFKIPASRRCNVVILIFAEYFAHCFFSGALVIQLAFTMLPSAFGEGKMKMICLTNTWLFVFVGTSNFLGSFVIVVYRFYCHRQSDNCSDFQPAVFVGICIILVPFLTACTIVAQVGESTSTFRVCSNIGDVIRSHNFDKTYLTTILIGVCIMILFWLLSFMSRRGEQDQETSACAKLAPFQREKSHLVSMESTILLLAANVALVICIKLVIFMDPGDEIIVVSIMTYPQLILNLARPILHTLLSKWLRNGLIEMLSAVLPTRYIA